MDPRSWEEMSQGLFPDPIPLPQPDPRSGMLATSPPLPRADPRSSANRQRQEQFYKDKLQNLLDRLDPRTWQQRLMDRTSPEAGLGGMIDPHTLMNLQGYSPPPKTLGDPSIVPNLDKLNLYRALEYQRPIGVPAPKNELRAMVDLLRGTG